MNTVFNILSQKINPARSQLFIEVGLQGIALLILEDNTFNSVVCFRFETNTTIKSVSGAIQEVLTAQPWLKQPFKKISILYTFPDSVLVPYELMNAQVNKEMLEFVYGDTHEETVKMDLILKPKLYNVYRIPSTVDSLMKGTFPSAMYTHLYSVLPDIIKADDKAHLYVIFGSNNIIVLLKKAGKLQVIQNFSYKTPEDVAYHLLAVCNSFDVVASESVLHISGMLDKVSSLYNELYKYFLLIEFEKLPENFQYADEIKDQPAHYFSHLFAVASCV